MTNPRETLAALRARDAAAQAALKKRLAVQVAKRQAEQVAQAQSIEQVRLAQAAERKRVAELSARGGVPSVEALHAEFRIEQDAEASMKAQLSGDPDWMRWRSVDGSRLNLTFNQLPRIDFDATRAARDRDIFAPVVLFWP